LGGLGPLNDPCICRLALGGALRTTSQAPSQRWGHAMTYDTVRGEVLLFGGRTLSGPHGDLWSWDGTTWTRRALAPAPPPSEEHQMAYDPIREQTVLFTQDSWVLQWHGDRASDLCDVAIDRDGDGLAGCDDPDCWGSCTPSCPPGTTCSVGPACGDQAIDTLETCRLCPVDIGACTADCGDGFCDAPETVASCPGDC